MDGKIKNLMAQANAPTAEASSVTSASRVFQTEMEAENVFEKLKEKLFDIKCWNGESEITSFSLFDPEGIAQPEKRANVGDFIKTVLPSSGKDDWVKIVGISVAPDEIVLTVQPSHNPTEIEGKSTTSHFFIADSTNNFCLQRKHTKINFCVIGLNEKTNTAETSGLIEAVRNLATAKIGSLFGIQKTQWQIFCDNFIEMSNER